VGRSACFTVAMAGLLVPLLLIGVAALASGRFNLVNNALSDLGHATRSPVAWIFNLGLSACAFLLALYSAMYAIRHSKAIAALLMVSAYFLNLVAVFDEVYGRLHFWVSVMFFISLAALLVAYLLSFKKHAPAVVVALAASIATWVLHMVYGVPRGAAIPELVSIAAVIPFYLSYSREVCTKQS